MTIDEFEIEIMKIGLYQNIATENRYLEFIISSGVREQFPQAFKATEEETLRIINLNKYYLKQLNKFNPDIDNTINSLIIMLCEDDTINPTQTIKDMSELLKYIIDLFFEQEQSISQAIRLEAMHHRLTEHEIKIRVGKIKNILQQYTEIIEKQSQVFLIKYHLSLNVINKENQN